MATGQGRLGRRAFATLALAPILAVSAPGLTPVAAARQAIGGNATRPGASPPNILLLVSDDQTWNTFSRELMPEVYSWMVDRGVQFNRAYINESECCPSRSEIMTGLYAQHTGVDSNDVMLNRPTIIQALHDVGYRTMLGGKFLNSEPCDTPQPGFDRWVCEGGVHPPKGSHGYTDPILNIDGTWTSFTGYTTDILANFVTSFFTSTPTSQPWFAMYTPTSPHLPANDPRCKNTIPPLRDPGYYDDTTTDGKPLYMQRGPLSAAEAARVDADHQAMVNAVQCLDGSMDTILSALAADPAAERNTIVIYLSDNGFQYGEHRREGKVVPYEESVRVPMIIRAPMLHPESQPTTTDALAENVDIAATIAEVVGFPWGADGVSLVPLLTGAQTSVRDAALIENCEGASYPCSGHGQGDSAATDPPPDELQDNRVPSFYGIVTSQYKYIQYQTGEKELYDYAIDPYEIANLVNDPNHAGVVATLAAQLAQMTAPPPVDTTIVTGPTGSLGERAVSYTYFSQDRHATYRCRLRLDGVEGDWFNCNGQAVTFGGLTDGSYIFEVAGTDPAGSSDATPASRSFSISSTGPSAQITTHPAPHQQASTLAFGFASGSAHVTFACSLQPLGTAPVFLPCNPLTGVVYAGLADGTWDFQVAATDLVTGATTSPPAEWLTNVDNAGPKMIQLIVTNIAGPSRKQSLPLDFYPDEATIDPFECQLDGQAPVDCSLGHFTAKGLADGRHTITITADDTIGNVGVTSIKWTVDTVAPVVTITSYPPDPSGLTSATFTFVADDPHATFICALDTHAPVACTSPTSYTDLALGTHTFTVTATDAAHNSASASYTWTITPSARSTPNR